MTYQHPQLIESTDCVNHQTTGFKINGEGQNCKSLAKFVDDIIRCTLVVFDPDVATQHDPATRHMFIHHHLSLVLISTLNDRTIFWLDNSNPKHSTSICHIRHLPERKFVQKFFVQNEHGKVIRTENTEIQLEFRSKSFTQTVALWCILFIQAERKKKTCSLTTD